MKSFKSFFSRLALLATLAVAAIATIPAQAGMSLALTTRTAQMAGVVSDVGSGGKLKLYNNCTIPTGVNAATGCTLLATITWTSVIGTATAGTVVFDTVGITQSVINNGLPVFAHITTSGDVVKARVDICGAAPCWTFTGSVS
ncbi:MAG: hypothetical protein CFE44_26725, partial [Burkholderiales bacterium PBB4]